MLKAHGADFNQKDRRGETLLNEALDSLAYTIGRPTARVCVLKLIHYLLESGVNPRECKRLRTFYLDYPSRQHYEEIPSYEEEATPLYPLVIDADKYRNLLEEHDEYEKLLTALLVHGDDAYFIDSQDCSLVYHSIYKGNMTALRCLITHGFDVNFIDGSDCTPLAHAVNNDNVAAVDLLLKLGAQINYPKGQAAKLLMKAVKYFSLEMVSLLVAAGAQPAEEDQDGVSLFEELDFHCKCEKERLEGIVIRERRCPNPAFTEEKKAIVIAGCEKEVRDAIAELDSRSDAIKSALLPALANARSYCP